MSSQSVKSKLHRYTKFEHETTTDFIDCQRVPKKTYIVFQNYSILNTDAAALSDCFIALRKRNTEKALSRNRLHEVEIFIPNTAVFGPTQLIDYYYYYGQEEDDWKRISTVAGRGHCSVRSSVCVLVIYKWSAHRFQNIGWTVCRVWLVTLPHNYRHRSISYIGYSRLLFDFLTTGKNFISNRRATRYIVHNYVPASFNISLNFIDC